MIVPYIFFHNTSSQMCDKRYLYRNNVFPLKSYPKKLLQLTKIISLPKVDILY